MEAEQTSEKDAHALDAVSDRYAIRSILGRGASATVFLADDHATERPVAIKLLAEAEQSGPDGAICRFRAEAEATRRLQHPNIIRLVDDGVTADCRSYFVTEYTPGRSLAAVLREHGRLTVRQAIEAGIGIAGALAYVHSKNLVHRDLKPSNVLIPGWPEAPDFRGAKLLDFGVAGRLEQGGRTQAGMIYGTLRYMSPEQIKGEAQSAATDVYGFGLLLYEMLTGRAPAKRERDLTTLLIAIRDGLSEEDLKAVEPAVADIIRRCVRSDHSERPTMAAVLAELREQRRNAAFVAAIAIRTGLPAQGVPGPLPLPHPSAAAISAATPPSLPETTLSLEKTPGRQLGARAGASAVPRRWMMWTAAGIVAALLAIAAIPYFLSSHAVPNPASDANTVPGETAAAPSHPPTSNPAGSSETTGRAVRFAAGLLLMCASIGLAFGLRKWLGSRSQIKSQALQLVFGAQGRTDLSATIAIQLQDLVSNVRKLDQRILAGTVALMLDEYGKATDTKDRQAALMNVVAISEKLAVNLSPWYERYKGIIASAVAVMGGVSGLLTAINSVLQHKH